MTTILQLVLAILVTAAVGVFGWIWIGEASELREAQRERRAQGAPMKWHLAHLIVEWLRRVARRLFRGRRVRQVLTLNGKVLFSRIVRIRRRNRRGA